MDFYKKNLKKNDENEELSNLFKIPKKDNNKTTPHILEFKENDKQQADLLFLPVDNGYKYALVVVDLGSRLTDAVALKAKSAEAMIQTDPGSEFKGVVKRYFDEKGIYIRYGRPGRHRQQALVEQRNKIIGKLLFMRMTAEELLTGTKSISWVEDLPLVIEAINERYNRDKEERDRLKKKVPDKPLGDGQDLLKEGTIVRVQLDEPIDVTTATLTSAITNESTTTKLAGRFRASDIRWNPKPTKIDRILLEPGKPPMYFVISPPYIPYTRNQLQIVEPGEKKPHPSTIRGEPDEYIVEKILSKKKIGNRWYYLVKWRGYDDPKDNTWELKTKLMEDVPDIVNQYEQFDDFVLNI
ncbi:hypothetical protein PPL_12641 [Heterostelium album PN500]|uniref:Chromo domain-containing protein n=1 Tax=Heterostelium pallidum (strain ATCC 26659 / Pp 5 / PN500) TaxID=670386 RepID=D3BN63_HETP5|nr:hypothetical protein PPL_12641 [Heterostelium album PN500]EFA77425.1 hypothetical protein PPL_12641 [Heterostelium album PN500]|eukprot:XP_020429554.1 hypothetical protein PPL_12641 [Heterostelium album PN500]